MVSYGTITITDITDGYNTATVYIYIRSDNGTPSKPSTSRYTFATGSFTVPTGWSRSIPADDGTPCYMSSATVVSQEAEANLDWSNPVKILENGADGRSVLNIVEKYRCTAELVVPTDDDDDDENTPNENDDTNGSDDDDLENSGDTIDPTKWNDSPLIPTADYPYLWSYTIMYYDTGDVASTAPRLIGMYTEDGKTPIITSDANSVTITDPVTGASHTITNGQDGKTYNTFIRYSEFPNGQSYSDTPSPEKKYIGICTTEDSNPPDPLTHPGAWKWSRYIGQDGSNGAAGPAGPAGISVIKVEPIYWLKTVEGGMPDVLIDGIEIEETGLEAGQWTKSIPTYTTGGIYYSSIQTFLSGGTSPIFSDIVEDVNTTTTNRLADEAKQLATNVDIKTKYMWHNLNGNNYPIGTYLAQSLEHLEDESKQVPFNAADASTYGYNNFLSAGGIKLRYNDIELTSIGGASGITLSTPVINNDGDIIQSIARLTISANGGMTFLDNNRNKVAEYGANGVKLFAGGNEGLSITPDRIIIGRQDEGVHLEIDSGQLGFYNSYTNSSERTNARISFISDSKLYIPYSVVLNEMIVGETTINGVKTNLWAWTVIPNTNHLRLVWQGGAVDD